MQSIKTIYEDTLKTKETIYLFSDFEKIFSVLNHEWAWNYPDRRKDLGIKAYCIAKEGFYGQQIKDRDHEQLRETKFVKKVQFDTEYNIYGNKVAMLSYRRPYAGVIIEDTAITNTMRSIWKIIWDML